MLLVATGIWDGAAGRGGGRGWAFGSRAGSRGRCTAGVQAQGAGAGLAPEIEAPALGQRASSRQGHTARARSKGTRSRPSTRPEARAHRSRPSRRRARLAPELNEHSGSRRGRIDRAGAVAPALGSRPSSRTSRDRDAGASIARESPPSVPRRRPERRRCVARPGRESRARNRRRGRHPAAWVTRAWGHGASSAPVLLASLSRGAQSRLGHPPPTPPSTQGYLADFERGARRMGTAVELVEGNRKLRKWIGLLAFLSSLLVCSLVGDG